MLSNVWFLLYFTGGYCAAQLIRCHIQTDGKKQKTDRRNIYSCQWGNFYGTSCKPRESKYDKMYYFLFFSCLNASPDNYTLQNTFL